MDFALTDAQADFVDAIRDLCRRECGTQSHEYELYLAVEDIDHSRTKTKSPQTNGICERFHRTILDEFYRIAFRKKIYQAIDELQTDLDTWLLDYNPASSHPSIYTIEEKRFC